MKLVLAIFFLFNSTSCLATNYYVSSTIGDQKNNGLSPSKTKKLIQQAADLTRPGDTVFVMNGDYTNSCPTCNVVNIPTSGTIEKYIVYTNLKGHAPRITFNGWAGFSIRNGISYIKISGFEVIGNNASVTLAQALQQPQSCNNTSGTYEPKFNGNGIVIDGREKNYPHHITISNNIVHDCGGGGISAIHADYITVEDNLVYNTSWYSVFGTSGISFYQFMAHNEAKGYHNYIRRNKCFNNKSLVPWFKTCNIEDGNGIIIDDFMNKQNGSTNGEYTSRTLVENNVCWNNGGTGIHAFQSGYVDIFNNTAYRNSRAKKLNAGEILAGSSNNIRMINNILVTDAKNRINSNYENKNITYENNLHYNISTPRKMLVSISSASCIRGRDPSFRDPKLTLDADFTLRSNSPAIEKANIKWFSATDYLGKLRAMASAADIGAFEFYNRR